MQHTRINNHRVSVTVQDIIDVMNNFYTSGIPRDAEVQFDQSSQEIRITWCDAPVSEEIKP